MKPLLSRHLGALRWEGARRGLGELLNQPDRLVGDRLLFGDPWIELLAIPVALSLNAITLATSLGRMVMVPVQIQFHELGHAMLAWLSARSALPLPFGFTFWTEQRSVFTGACMVFLLGLFFVRALRERRHFGVVVAAVALCVFVVLSMIVSLETSRMFIVVAGLAGELFLPTFVMLAFYFPLPDRLRWDFFRFVLLVPATGTWLAALSLWFGVARGTRALPLGSILGTPGDGSGDLDGLLARYDFSESAITAMYTRMAWVTLLIVGVTYSLFAVRAVRKLAPIRREVVNPRVAQRLRERKTSR